MLLKIIALATSLLGLSEVENIIHTKTGSTEKVVILCPNGTITIERWTNQFSPMVITNFHPTIPGFNYYIPTPNTVTNFQP